MAQQLPTGGSVAAGSATINASGSTLNVNQTTDRAIINWSDFSVGQGATVNFNQPGTSSATLNRVTGSTPSSIAGTINAPGTVLLVNPNGIAITSSGVVNVGSFAASTLDIKDNDFMSGKYTFTGNGASAGVTNAGRINVSDGGFAALLGGQVANDGVISARLGKVGLGSGELITLDLAGDGFLSVAVPTSSLNGIVGSDGHPLVSNKGKIIADGGTVYLSAATAAGLLRDAVYVPGTIRANTVGTRAGKIVIGGGAGGKVTISGKVKANGGKTAKGGTIDISGAQVAVSGKVKASGTSGGTIKVTGTESTDVSGEVSAKGNAGKGGVVIITADDVTIDATAKIDVSGLSGGTLLIGGDYQGGANSANNFSIELIDNALTTSIAAGATLNASGTDGNGSNIVVWSDNLTTFAGALDVSGTNGSGGFAEVSGHKLLDFTGTANLAGTAGAGTLLLDPENVTITSDASLNSPASYTVSSGTYTASADNSVILVSTLQAALASGNVIVTTGGSGSTGSQAGDITVASDIAWSANTLTLQAYHSIYINGNMSATGTAGLTLTTNNGGIGGTITYGGHVTFANTSQALTINGTAYTLIDSMSGLQNINNGLTGNYALITSLDASSVTDWVPLGADSSGTVLNSSLGFTGKFTGLGNTISNLTINRPSGYPVGLFGRVSNTSVSNLNLANISVTGSAQVGSLIGNAYNSLIADVNVSGTITGNSYVGGVVGMGNSISIVDTHADVIVRANGSGNAGGLLGWSSTSSSIVRSSVTGSVSALGSYVGGLAGYMSGSITDSYSTAAVSSGVQYAGGLVGGSVTSLTFATSWSSGLVTAPSSAGGIIGTVGGTATFSNVYWDTETSGQAYALGGSTSTISGTTGLTTAQARMQSSYSGFDFTNVWYMVDGDTRPFLRSEFSTTIADAHQLQLMNMTSASRLASYTLASDIDLGAALSNASEMWGSKGWVPIGSYNYEFSGALDGNSHIIDGLTISRPTINYVGLFGYTGTAIISNIGLTNVNVTGKNYVGALAGDLSGNVTDAFATGSVTGVWQVGGLLGSADDFGNLGLTNTRLYANVKVVASGGQGGGLIGVNNVALSQAYSVGQVTGSSSAVNALIGSNSGTVTYAYYDMLTSGRTGGAGTGYTTTQLQSALPTGFNSSYWGIVAGASYPYLKAFYSGAPQVISGTVYTDYATTAAAGAQVSALVNGTAVGSAYAGANGYYNLLLDPGTIASNSQVAVYTTGTNAGVTYKQDASSSLSGMNILGAWLTEYGASSSASLSAISSGLLTATGSSGVSTSLANEWIIASNASFTLDQADTRTGILQISSAGAVTQASGAAISANLLKLFAISTNASFSLLDAGNSIASLWAPSLGSGSLSVYDSANLALSTIVANGGVLIRSAGSLTLNSSITSAASGDAVVLAAGTTFVNNFNSTAISTPNGRWIIYAGTPTGSSFNNLNSGNDAIWNATYAANAPSTIASGNRYVFAYQPTLTFTSTSSSKYYGNTADVSSNYTVSSNVSAVSGAYTVASVSSLYTGTPTLSSAGTAVTATVDGGPYAINIAQGSVASTGAYALNFVSSGQLTVNKASLIIYVGTAYKTYGNTYTGSSSDYSVSGLKNSDTVTSVTLTSSGAAGTANVGNYILTGSNATGTGLSNYNVLYSAGTLVVSPAILTITAANGTKTYGTDLTFAGTEFAVSGLKNSDAVSSVTLTSNGAAGTANVGSYQIAASAATGSGLSNYLIYYNTGSLSVTRASLTITAIDQSKTYGTAYNLGTTAFTTTGTLYNGDTVTGVTLTSGAAAATAATGWQTIYASNATGTGLSNYNITYSAAGKLTVNPALLTITANDQSKTYGVANGLGTSAYTITSGSLYNGDTITGVTLSSAGAAGSANVGTYAINGSGATGTGLYNYTITYLPGTLTVNQASLVVTATDQSKIYGNTLDLGSTGYTVTGNLYNGDTLTSVTLASTGADATAAAGTHAITASNAQGSGLSNYNITYADGALTVNKATLIIYVGSASKIYGNTYTGSSSDYSVSGLKNSDAVSSVTLTSSGAVATANVGSYALTGSNVQGAGLSNYNVYYQAGSLYVSPAILTITAANGTKTYGTDLTFGGTEFSASGLKNSDTVSSVTLTSSGAAGTANTGSYQIAASAATGTGLSNYLIYYNTGYLSVTPASLVITASDQSKTYGAAYNLGTTAFSITSGTLYNSDTITGVTLTSGATAATAAAGWQTIYASNATGTGLSNYNITYSTAGKLTVNTALLTVTVNDQSKTYGTALSLGSTGYTLSGTLYNGDTVTGVTLTSAGAVGTANAGTYAINGSGATGTGLYNYTISYVSGTLTVNKASLVVTATDQSKIYGNTLDLGTTAYGVTGNFYNGDTVSAVTLASAGADATATVAGGPYAITASNATGTGLSNYNITYANGSLTVNKATLIVYAGTVSKGYGTTYSPGADYTVSGLKNSDAVTSVDLTSTGAAATANVGNYALTASNAQGTGLGNYNISYQAGTLNISPAILTIVAANGTKTYGTDLTFSGTEFTATGLVNGDTVSSVQLASAGAAGTANVGAYAITASNASGSGLSNYLIYYNQGSLSVTQASLVITVTNQSKTYGGAAGLGTTGFTTTGTLYNGDTVTGVTLASAGAVGTANVGGYGINASNATGIGLSNYSITYVPGTLTVNPALLTITANDQSKTYGDTLALGTTGFTTTGTLYNGDAVSSVTLSSAGANAVASVASGPYAITASNAQGSGLSNYTITYVSGSLTVNKASLVVTASDASKNYGQTLTFNGTEFTSSGLKNGEAIGSVTLTSAGAAAGADVNGSPYAIVASAATGGTFNAGNYNITYVNGALTVSPASLTVTITPNAATKVYGDTLSFNGTEFTSVGLVNGDTISSVTLASTGTAATATVGQYDIVPSNAVFGVGSALNYNIVYSVLANGLTVTPRSLVITADAVSRIYGDANPATGTATGNNLVNGDSITGVALVTSATTASGVGNYSLTASNATGTGLSNYAITYATTANGLTVTPRALVITADAVSRIYGDANPAIGTATGNNLVNGDTIAGVTLSSSATTASGVGSYSLTGSNATGTGLSNYAITYATVANGLTVTPRSLVITADNVSRIYGDANPTTGTATGNNLVNGDSITGVTLSSSATTTSGVGSYDLTGSNATGTGLSNYAITYATTANGLAVMPRALVITADAVSRIYGDANPTTGTATGNNLVNGDSITGVTLSSSATTASGVGSYDLTGSNATGTGLSNYAITYATVANGLTVTPRSLVITADNVSRIYGDANPTTGTATGNNLVNGDSIAGVTLSSSATTASGVGSYSLTGSNATGTGLSNYAITYATVANGLTVTPRSLVITADAVSRIYGDANPATGTATGNNLVNGDTIAGVTLSSSATTVSGVGSYDLTGSNATGTGLSNYAITYATVANGLTVTPRALVITADNVSRIYGDANPTTGTATGNNLVNGDTIAGVTLVTSATTASGVGSYDLTGSNAAGTGLSNYAITYATTANGLTVTPRALAVTADAQSKTAGDTDPLLTYRITTGNLVGADTLSGALMRVAGEDVGLYAILQGSLVASANYRLTYIGANLKINAAPVVAQPNTGDYPTSQYVGSGAGNTLPIVTISYQPSVTTVPAIGVVRAPTVVSNTAAPDVSQAIVTAGGPAALFLPISQFDKVQYSTADLPAFAPEASQATVLTMIARAEAGNQQPFKIDALWRNDAASWANLAGGVAKNVSFGDGNGTKRVPAGDNGFAFVNGQTDITALLKQGPVMLGGAKVDGIAAPWMLALQVTADGKGIIANDPVTGQQVILGFDPATKKVGGIVSMIDPKTKRPVAAGATVPAFADPAGKVSVATWNALKSFQPAGYFAVSM